MSEGWKLAPIEPTKEMLDAAWADSWEISGKRKPRVRVDDSCGCVFCDLDIEPITVKITEGEWREMHPTKHGYVACTKQPKK